MLTEYSKNISIDLKHAKNDMYMVPTMQGLKVTTLM